MRSSDIIATKVWPFIENYLSLWRYIHTKKQVIYIYIYIYIYDLNSFNTMRHIKNYAHGFRFIVFLCGWIMTMTMTMKICLLPQIFTVAAKQMQDINTSEKASNSNLPLIIPMVKGAWSRSLWAPISVIRKKTFHFEGAENRKKRCIVREEWHRFIYIREWSI